MLLINLPLYIRAAPAGWALLGSSTLFCSCFVQCNPLSKEVSSFPRTEDWDVCCPKGAASSCHTVLSKLRSSPGSYQSCGSPSKVPPRGACADPSLLSTTWATVGMSSEKHSLALLELHFRLMKALFPRLENIKPPGFPATAGAIFRKS